MDSIALRAKLLQVLEDVWRDEKPHLPFPEITDDTILLRTGLDSMGFAIFVARLDEELGYDPFSLDQEAFYPRSFGEFYSFYNKYIEHAS